MEERDNIEQVMGPQAEHNSKLVPKFKYDGGSPGVFLRDFPFALVYRSDEQGITIYAMARHARRPGYWRSRTDDR
jgi:hypothetical protein